VPAWLEQCLSRNTFRMPLVDPDPEPRRGRRDGYVKPSPKTDRAMQVLAAHPTWTSARVAAEAACSEALVDKTRRQLKQQATLPAL
jgi:hypothetical protein